MELSHSGIAMSGSEQEWVNKTGMYLMQLLILSSSSLKGWFHSAPL